MAIETSPQCRRLSGPHLSLGAQQPLDPHGPLYRKEFDQAALIRCFSLKMANRTQLRAEPQQMDLVHPAAVLFELLGGLGSPASRPSAALMGRSEPRLAGSAPANQGRLFSAGSCQRGQRVSNTVKSLLGENSAERTPSCLTPSTTNTPSE